MILLDGREMSVEAAAIALQNWTIGRTPEALHPPFDIRYPYEVAVTLGPMGKTVKGGYQDIMALQRLVNRK